MLTNVELNPWKGAAADAACRYLLVSSNRYESGSVRNITLLCALDGACKRVRRAEALAEDTAEVEHEVKGQTWVH